jgi:hypothetical protein
MRSFATVVVVAAFTAQQFMGLLGLCACASQGNSREKAVSPPVCSCCMAKCATVYGKTISLQLCRCSDQIQQRPALFGEKNRWSMGKPAIDAVLIAPASNDRTWSIDRIALASGGFHPSCSLQKLYCVWRK